MQKLTDEQRARYWKKDNLPLTLPSPKPIPSYDPRLDYEDFLSFYDSKKMQKPPSQKKIVSDWMKLKSLITFLELGKVTKLRGSPLSTLSFAISDALASLETSVLGILSSEGNDEVNFVEEYSHSQEQYADQISGLKKTTVFSKDGKDDSTYYSNELKADSKIHQYGENFVSAATDPLGNPLQLTISFESRTFSERDRIALQASVRMLQEFFEKMATGIVDWRFARYINKFQYKSPPSISSKKKRSQNFHAQKHRFNSKKTKGTPARNKKSSDKVTKFRD